jgi:hypothetical protein
MQKRKPGNKVLSGQVTVDEARAGLPSRNPIGLPGRPGPSRPGYQPREPDWECVREAARAKVVMPQQFNPVITKVAKTAQKRYGQQMAAMRGHDRQGFALLDDPLGSVSLARGSGQAARPQERLVVAGLEQRLIRAAVRPAPAHSPFSREPSGGQGHLRTEGDKHRARDALAGPGHTRHPVWATKVYRSVYSLSQFPHGCDGLVRHADAKARRDPSATG